MVPKGRPLLSSARCSLMTGLCVGEVATALLRVLVLHVPFALGAHGPKSPLVIALADLLPLPSLRCMSCLKLVGFTAAVPYTESVLAASIDTSCFWRKGKFRSPTRSCSAVST